jgi:hypothetical protein
MEKIQKPILSVTRHRQNPFDYTVLFKLHKLLMFRTKPEMHLKNLSYWIFLAFFPSKHITQYATDFNVYTSWSEIVLRNL